MSAPTKRRVVIRVKRFDPDTGRIWWQEYEVEVDRYQSLATVLQRIREEVDPTLAFQAGCRFGVCGACAVKVNGIPRLACQTLVLNEAGDEGVVTVEPLDFFPVVRDLVVDRRFIDGAFRKARAWLEPGPEPLEDGFRIEPALQKKLWKLDKCIVCGVCFSVCPLLDAGLDYPGPAAIAKLVRFSMDPRDALRDARLEDASEWIWRCLRCGLCALHCPYSIQTPGAVAEARRRLIEKRVGRPSDIRHVEAIVESVKRLGRMNEKRVFIETAGFARALREAIVLARKVGLPRPPERVSGEVLELLRGDEA
ncbi:succinate dehydrogenase and fumarate reductase iron-sulfur protein [Pyrolobus fumarii 1A]|uniref:succinate dehydrogenase n=1 Tax=Pyrolobus fumarii (strain DSM 11204 / 1A) TaxID=694429 RepID=G0EGB2_PYRF1|nr:2Fe-2S iron-sulfur cluster-binding protein [Pyrolobus fumarii]AEM39137.1 succinate dehydrogenase and fumarate reductase iron-sulfur protein [Pyrolobus fumarii 1A]